MWLELLEVLGVEVLFRGAGGAVFVLHNAKTWQTWHYVAWVAVIGVCFEILSQLVQAFGRSRAAATIPPRGKHLDEFNATDRMFILINKVSTSIFTYDIIRCAWNAPLGIRVVWRPEQVDFFNTVGSLVALFVVYDFFYTLFHRALHHRRLYKFIHKHHHKQKAPSRGNPDALNVHPVEFLCGEYDHLLALYLVAAFIVPVHIISLGIFVISGGFMASLNHTRFDISFPLIPQIYQVKYHDIHHWYPESNYGQYSMFWDRLLGSFKPYPKDKAEKCE